MTVPVVKIEDYGRLVFAAGPPPLMDTLGRAEPVAVDGHFIRWQVTVGEEVTLHGSKHDAVRELRVRAGRLVGSAS